MTLNKLTRSLYGLARLSNKARIMERLLEGNPRPLIVHEKNRLIYRLMGRFLR